jgi:hypothetical protein
VEATFRSLKNPEFSVGIPVEKALISELSFHGEKWV